MKNYTTPEVEILSFALEDLMVATAEQIEDNRTVGDNIFEIFGT